MPTPEHLFAAGYAAGFRGALDFVAKQKKRDATRAMITYAVSAGPRDGGGFGIAVKMRVEDRNITQTELHGFVRQAHEKKPSNLGSNTQSGSLNAETRFWSGIGWKSTDICVP